LKREVLRHAGPHVMTPVQILLVECLKRENQNMDIQEKIEALRTLGYQVEDRIGSRPATGEIVLYVNGTDIDEQFVDQLLIGVNFRDVRIRRDKWLSNRI